MLTDIALLQSAVHATLGVLEKPPQLALLAGCREPLALATLMQQRLGRMDAAALIALLQELERLSWFWMLCKVPKAVRRKRIAQVGCGRLCDDGGSRLFQSLLRKARCFDVGGTGCAAVVYPRHSICTLLVCLLRLVCCKYRSTPPDHAHRLWRSWGLVASGSSTRSSSTRSSSMRRPRQQSWAWVMRRSGWCQPLQPAQRLRCASQRRRRPPCWRRWTGRCTPC